MNVKAEDIIWDCMHILAKGKPTNDFRVNEDIIMEKVNSYREMFILQQYYKTNRVDPVVVQHYGVFEFTRINSADDESLNPLSICLGKYTLPRRVALPDGIALRLTLPSSQKRVFKIAQDTLYLMISLNDRRLQMFSYYFEMFDSVYIYPYEDRGNAQVVLVNPLEGPVFQTEKVLSGSVEPLLNYTVYGGQVDYVGTVYDIGATVVGTLGQPFYSGPGYLKHQPQYRQRNYRDPYPISAAMARQIILEILTKDYQIEAKQVADIVQDSQDQARILAS